MKIIQILILFIFHTNTLKSQKMNLMKVESILDFQIPDDYLKYRGNKLHKEDTVFFRIDNWVFWDLENATSKTIELRKNGLISSSDFAFAENQDRQILFYPNSQKSSNNISLLDFEIGILFYVFSLCEFEKFDKTQHLIDEIKIVAFENQDLAEIKDCTGSLFNYAFKLKTSKFDDNFSEKRNERALKLFFETAEKGHPEAASQIASYYFLDKVNVDKVIEWREKAIKYGSNKDIYELADFIIDYKIEEIDKAINLLESLFNDQRQREKALLKLSRIYMKGTGGKLNLEKGIEYTEECAKSNNYNALSDLALYYYKGLGVDKNIQKAAVYQM